ncbi:MAG: anti-sigma factor antagonist [Thiothrix sp.]|nr:anti-sigma factor antagonist [Thiothrix sp.]HPQ93982.1 STAS domain-containing protein [Thiolinea sp.]
MEGSIRLTPQDERTTVITLQGPLDHDMAQNLATLAARTQTFVILNCRQIPYITAAGSLALLKFYQTTRKKPVLQEAGPELVSTLQLTGAAGYVILNPDADPTTAS